MKTTWDIIPKVLRQQFHPKKRQISQVGLSRIWQRPVRRIPIPKDEYTTPVSRLGSQVRILAPFYTTVPRMKASEYRSSEPHSNRDSGHNATNFRAKGFLDGFHTYIVHVGHMACV